MTDSPNSRNETPRTARVTDLARSIEQIQADVHKVAMEQARREGAERMTNRFLMVILALIPLVGGATVWSMKGILVAELQREGLIGLPKRVEKAETDLVRLATRVDAIRSRQSGQ